MSAVTRSSPFPNVSLSTPHCHPSLARHVCLRTPAHTVLPPAPQTLLQRQVLCWLPGSTNPSPKGWGGVSGALLDDAEGSLLKASSGRGETPGKGLLQGLHAPLAVVRQLLKSAGKRALLRSRVPGAGWGCRCLVGMGAGLLTCWFQRCCPGG